jgi:hypothetical protein
MKSEDDDALRSALADAHHGDAARTPPLQRLLGPDGQRTPRRDSSMPWLVTCASLGAALGLAAWLVSHLGPPPAQLPPGTSWSFPTDFLLQTPGSVTLQTVPQLAPGVRELLLESGIRRGNP